MRSDRKSGGYVVKCIVGGIIKINLFSNSEPPVVLVGVLVWVLVPEMSGNNYLFFILKKWKVKKKIGSL